MATSKKHWTSAEDQTLWDAMEHGQSSSEVVSLLRNRGLTNCDKRMRELRKCGKILKPFEVQKGVLGEVRDGRTWPKELTIELLNLVESGTLSWYEVSQKVGKSISACKKHHERVTGVKVQTDLRKVQVPLSQEQIKQYTQLLQSKITVHLTSEQIMYAKKSKEEGKSWVELAKELGTNDQVIRYRCLADQQRWYWNVEDCYRLWHARVVEGLEWKKVQERFPERNCKAKQQDLRDQGLWLYADGTLSGCIQPKQTFQRQPTETKGKKKTFRRPSNDDKKLLEDDKQPGDVHNEESEWDNEEEVRSDMNRRDENINCDFDSTNGTEGPGKRKQRGQIPRGGERTMGTSSYAKSGSRNDVNLESEETDIERIFEQASGDISPEVLETLLPERPVTENESGDTHIKKVSCQNDTPASNRHSTTAIPIKAKETSTSRDKNEGAFTGKLIGPENYQQLSCGSVQQPYNDDSEKQKQNQRTNIQLNGDEQTKQDTRHGIQIGYPFQGSDSMSEDCAAFDNEKVDIVKIARVAESLINETPSKINYPFLTSRSLARVNVDKKSGVIDSEKTSIYGLPTPERKELESGIRDSEHHGQEKPRCDNLTIPFEERTLSEHGKVSKFDRGISEDVLKTETKGDKQYNVIKEECSDKIKGYTPGVIVKEYSNETKDEHQWNAFKEECRDKTNKREFRQDGLEMKPERDAKRGKLCGVYVNPFKVETAADGQKFQVHPQCLWLNASPVHELPGIGTLQSFAEILGQKNAIWIAELIETREYKSRCFVFLRWMYRPIDLPVHQRNMKRRGKKELISSNHFDVVDARCVIRPVKVMECESQQDSHFRSDNDVYYFRQAYNCADKKLSPHIQFGS